MAVPLPHEALAAIAGYLRRRLAEVGGPPRHSVGAVEHGLVVAAGAPFALTSYARARLLRQLHASGLLTEREVERSAHLVGVAR